MSIRLNKKRRGKKPSERELLRRSTQHRVDVLGNIKRPSKEMIEERRRILELQRELKGQ